MSASSSDSQTPLELNVCILGNSGSGKSFLCNCLLSDRAFEEGEDSVDSVTTKTEAVEVNVTDTLTVRVFNVTGMFEMSAAESDRNKREIHRALVESATASSKTIILFVLRVTAGYINLDDVVAYQLLASAYSFHPSSVSFIANDLPETLPPNFKTDFTYRLQDMLKLKELPNISFISRVPSSSKSSFTSYAPVIQSSLILSLLRCLPHASSFFAPKLVHELDFNADRIAVAQTALRVPGTKPVEMPEERRREMEREERESVERAKKTLLEKKEEIAKGKEKTPDNEDAPCVVM